MLLSKLKFVLCAEAETFEYHPRFATVVLLVDRQFSIEDGLRGMQRNVILRVCNLLWNDAEKIRTVCE